MCPDEQLLSAYVDNEIPVEWQQRVGNHLNECEKCRAVVNDYRLLKQKLENADITIPDHITERVIHAVTVHRTVNKSRTFWNQRVSIPIPLAAAAAVIFMAALALGLFNLGSASSEPAITAADEIIIPPQEVGVQSLEEALQLLESKNAHIEIFIQLPAETGLQGMGEPLLIREADYQPR